MVDIIKFKDSLHEDIMRMYRARGYSYAVNSVNALISSSTKKAKLAGKPELGIQIRGECCEILLMLGIMEYARLRNLQWFVSKGLAIKRKDRKKGTTELDVTLFTPSKVVLFESKYRKDKFELVDKCKIVPSYGHVFDVYKQNLMHLDNLRYYLSDALIDIKLGKPFSLAMYIDDSSRATDKREPQFKSLMPLVDLKNLESYLSTVEDKKVTVWDIQKLYNIVKELRASSDEVFREHMKGVDKV